VEVGTTATMITIRDTKNREGAVLRVPAMAWRTFATTLKQR
jgi:hypothetical protein